MSQTAAYFDSDPSRARKCPRCGGAAKLSDQAAHALKLTFGGGALGTVGQGVEFWYSCADCYDQFRLLDRRRRHAMIYGVVVGLLVMGLGAFLAMREPGLGVAIGVIGTVALLFSGVVVARDARLRGKTSP